MCCARYNNGTNIEFFYDRYLIKIILCDGTYLHVFYAQHDHLYHLGTGIIPQQTCDIALSASLSSFFKQILTIKWHYHLGHLNSQAMKHLDHPKVIINFPSCLSTLSSCGPCFPGKQHKVSFFGLNGTCVEALLYVVHLNLK